MTSPKYWTSLSTVAKSTTILLLISLTITLLHFTLHPVRVLGMGTSIFYMDEKVTLAAYFTSVVAFVTGFTALSAYPTMQGRWDKISNILFGTFFMLLSMDEYLEMHEHINTLIKTHGKELLLGRLAYISWIFPLLLFVIIVLVMFWQLLRRERSHKIRRMIALGIASFIGVLFLELAGSVSFGKSIYLIFVGLEEFLEMAGVIVFFYVSHAKYGKV